MPDQYQTPRDNEQTEIELPLIRVRCADCTLEVGTRGSRADAQKLLEHLGWRLGAQMLCPECAKDRAKEFKRKYLD